MPTIVTEFGKFKYNSLHMGIWSSGDILQDKVDNIISDIQDVKTYIDDILVLRKKRFYNTNKPLW